MSCGFSDPGGCLAELAASAASSVASGAFSAIAHDFGSAAAGVTTWLWGQISSATAISFGGSGFALDWGITLGIGMIMCLLLFLVQVLASALRRDFSGLGRGLRGIIIAGLGTFAALLVLQSLLGAVDALSAGVVQAVTGGSIQQMGAKLFDGTAILSTNPAGLLLLALIALAACVVVWAAMMVRKLLVIVMAVFCPIAFSGAAADITASWVRKWIETVVALAVSKLILVLIMAIGLSVLVDGAASTGGATNSLTTSVIGLLILLMGGLAPWLAIKMVHFSGEHFHEIHGHAQAATQGAATVIAAPQKMAAVAQRAGFGGGSAGNRVGGAPGGAGAKQSPNGQGGIGGGEGATAARGNPAAQAGDGHGPTSAVGGPPSSGGVAAVGGGATASPVAAAAPMAAPVAVVAAAGSAARSAVGGQAERTANVSEASGGISGAARMAPKVDTHATAPIAPT